jgi:mannose-6-phosphate isomerase-like protein (cupin superfamily)
MTRRDLTSLISVFGLAGLAKGDPETAHSRAFQFDQLPVHRSTGGAETRPVMKGTLATGEAVEIHETTLMPGQMPHPAHKHVHSEFMMIREGTVEFLMEGRSEQVGPGGVLYAASGETHGLKNTGAVPAKYFVIAIGTESAH